jgi:hypothetical protein
MRINKRIWVSVILFVFIAVIYLIMRSSMVPPSFGTHGYYRYESVREQMDRHLVHGRHTSCKDCHAPISEKKAVGKHSLVSCEACHAPLRVHVTRNKKTGTMPIYRSYHLCAYCHEYLVARPAEFPQVILKKHVRDKGSRFSETVCLDCHNPYTASTE